MTVAELRPGVDADLPLVFRSWIYSYRTSRWARDVDDGMYERAHHDVIEAILARPGATLTIAAAPGEPGVILGWCVREGPTLHFVFVKRALRRLGIGRLLVDTLTASPVAPESRVERVSHRTPAIDAWMARAGWRYDPYLAFPPARRPVVLDTQARSA